MGVLRRKLLDTGVIKPSRVRGVERYFEMTSVPGMMGVELQREFVEWRQSHWPVAKWKAHLIERGLLTPKYPFLAAVPAREEETV